MIPQSIAIVRMLWFNLAFYGGLLLWTLVFILLSPFIGAWLFFVGSAPLAVNLRRAMHAYGRVCCRLLAVLAPVTARQFGKTLPQPCIITANHQSFFDPYCLGLFPIANIVFVVRSWPFRIPLYGRCMRKAGYLNVDELDADSFLRVAGARLREGATLVIFPEGTRTATGRIGRFHAGAFMLAVQENIPVVPLCIDGTGKVFPKNSHFGKPAPVTVTALEPVYPTAFYGFGALSGLRLQQYVKAAIQKVLRETLPA